MSLQQSIEDSAASVAKSHDHSILVELHILYALVLKFGSHGSLASLKNLESKLAQVSFPKAGTLTISESASALLERLTSDEAAIQEIRSLSELLFGPNELELNPASVPSKKMVESATNEVNEVSLDEVRLQLNSLVGLSQVKDQIDKLINVHRANDIREKNGMPRVPVGLHLVFTGSPGTGKTTVARIVGQMYKAIGLLPLGQLVEVDRSDLVAGFVGQTALKVQSAINEAKGGVLFIDEAYALSADSGGGFGDEAISTIVKAMEDHRDTWNNTFRRIKDCDLVFKIKSHSRTTKHLNY